MFKKRTLFIVGAGASAEVGLPVGAKLANKIAKLLTVDSASPSNPDGEQLIAQLYDKHPLSSNGYHRAAKAISEGVKFANSIDDFLDRHTVDELIQRVGKAAIVKTILAEERHSILIKTLRSRSALNDLENTWYLKFFRMLGARVSASNARQIFDNIAFIVFNYDRCLEHFLANALHLVYRMELHEAIEAVAECHIVHPYGIVADLYGSSGIPFGGVDGFVHDYVTPSAGIKVFTEQFGAGEVLQKLHAELFNAEQIIFLGFGYVEENMILLRPGTKMNLKPVFGTAFRMSESTIEEVKSRLAKFFNGAPSGILPAMLISNQECNALFDQYAMRLPS